MIDYLLSFSKFAQLSDIAVLIIYQFIVQRRTAFSFVLLFMCLLGVLHIFWEMYLHSLLEDSGSKEMVRHLWYAGFAISDFIFVMACVWTCNRLCMLRDRSCNLILIAYTIFGFIQMARYFDRVVIGTDLLGGVYSNLIPAINLGVSSVAIFYLIKTIALEVGSIWRQQQ